MLWGGRFKESLNNDALNFSSSIGFDKRLITEDITASKAHVAMLAKQNIITQSEADLIIKGLSEIFDLYKSGNWIIEEDKFEDIHSAIESKLYELIGETAGKTHTGRSRNDQVAVATRLWIKNAISSLTNSINDFQLILLSLAKDNLDTIIPGYTHLQRAQPISFSFHLLAYIEMLERDKQRLQFCFTQTDVSPLGSGAIAGSTLPLDPEFSASLLGFGNFSKNAEDAISNRDYLLDFINASVIGMMHLSRLSEEIILWSSTEWSFITLSDKYTTGSSLMPQKKNPDMAELIRGKSGRVYGNYMSLAVTLKGLPLSYNRDLQEDKEPVFDSFDTYYGSLKIASEMMKTATINKNRFITELNKSNILATDLADYLVIKGMPFRDAHKIIGNAVSFAETNNKTLSELTLEEFKGVHPIFESDIFEFLQIETCLNRKISIGSPNPKFVKDEIVNWERKLK